MRAVSYTHLDGVNLLKLHVKEAEKDGALNYIASTYDPYDQIIRDGLYPVSYTHLLLSTILRTIRETRVYSLTKKV